MLLDGYRELNSKRMFWIVLFLSGIVVMAFGAVGVKDEKLTFLWFDTPVPVPFGGPGPVPDAVRREFGISIWLAFAATILALISTASIFPDFISGGSIDLYLSKPISRLRLFVTKYLAGLLFVASQVAIFATASYVVIGVRGHTWENGIFLAIPLVVCFFSYLYAVSVLAGVVTRSTLAAVLLTVLFWFFLFCLDRGEVSLLMFKYGAERERTGARARSRFLRAGSPTSSASRPSSRRSRRTSSTAGASSGTTWSRSATARRHAISSSRTRSFTHVRPSCPRHARRPKS